MLFSAVEWTTPSNNNLDLYLARLSLDPFSQAMRFTPADTIRLTDSLLGEPAGADQIIGNVAVDAYGGINLVYYSVSPDGRYPYGDGSLPSYTPRYARFSRFPAPSSSFGLKLANLAPAFNPLAAPFTSSSTVIFPEYHGITSSGCMVYTTYMSAHSGTYGIYVNAINLCIADTSVDGFVTEVDPPIFADQYVTHNSAADLNYDGVIDAADVLIFQTSYQCGCGAP
jgi:hypothetical protein